MYANLTILTQTACRTIGTDEPLKWLKSVVVWNLSLTKCIAMISRTNPRIMYAHNLDRLYDAEQSDLPATNVRHRHFGYMSLSSLSSVSCYNNRYTDIWYKLLPLLWKPESVITITADQLYKSVSKTLDRISLFQHIYVSTQNKCHRHERHNFVWGKSAQNRKQDGASKIDIFLYLHLKKNWDV